MRSLSNLSINHSACSSGQTVSFALASLQLLEGFAPANGFVNQDTLEFLAWYSQTLVPLNPMAISTYLRKQKLAVPNEFYVLDKRGTPIRHHSVVDDRVLRVRSFLRTRFFISDSDIPVDGIRPPNDGQFTRIHLPITNYHVGELRTNNGRVKRLQDGLVLELSIQIYLEYYQFGFHTAFYYHSVNCPATIS